MSVLGRCQNCSAAVHEGEGYMEAVPVMGKADSSYAGQVVGFNHHYFHNTCPERPQTDPSLRKVQGT